MRYGKNGSDDINITHYLSKKKSLKNNRGGLVSNIYSGSVHALYSDAVYRSNV